MRQGGGREEGEGEEREEGGGYLWARDLERGRVVW